MTVGELRLALIGLPGDAEVMVDHRVADGAGGFWSPVWTAGAHLGVFMVVCGDEVDE